MIMYQALCWELGYNSRRERERETSFALVNLSMARKIRVHIYMCGTDFSYALKDVEKYNHSQPNSRLIVSKKQLSSIT